MIAEPATRRILPPRAHLISLLVFAALLASFVLLRYRGLWGESDTAVFSRAIRSMLDTGRLYSAPNQVIYPNGYGFQALAVFLMSLTGVSLATLQIIGAPLLMTWMVVPAWLLYREWSRSVRSATLATVVLFIQPEFLFPILRGTHEKFTRGLMLCALYLIVRGLRADRKSSPMTGLVVAFYITTFALFTFNDLLSASFMATTVVALALSWLVVRVRPIPRRSLGPALRRLTYATLAGLIVAVLVTFYVYPPAQHDLLVLRSIGDRLAVLFLSAGAGASNPYAATNGAWISFPVYLASSIANWLLLASSSAIWLSQTLGYIFRRRHARNPRELLLWSFFGATAVMGALSVAADVSGALSLNLQARIFPSFAIVAAPVVANWILTGLPRPLLSHRIARGAFAMALAVIAVLSVLKATNEPLVSNKWLFYVPDEMYALSWANTALAGQVVWTGYDERLETSFQLWSNGAPARAELASDDPPAYTRNFLVSDVTRARAVRLARPLPIDSRDLVIFDDGRAQIYVQPRSPR